MNRSKTTYLLIIVECMKTEAHVSNFSSKPNEDKMNHAPKLIPLWSDGTLQDIFRQKMKHRYVSYKFPDYGGIGVDTLLEENLFKNEVFKHSVDQTHFAAHVCALPFLPPNKVRNVCDNSSASEVKESEYKTFCSKLQALRRTVNTRGRERYRNEIFQCYKKVKRMDKKLQYKKILLPENIIHLAEIYPQQGAFSDTDFVFSGTCLAVSEVLNKHCLLHSGGEKLDKLCITVLQEASEPDKNFSPVDSEQNVVNLGEGKVLQISSSVAGSCYIRKKDELYFVNYGDLPVVKGNNHAEEKGILNVAASSYNPVEMLSVYEKGRIRLKNVELRKTIWKAKNHIESSMWKCSYGAHPQLALCLNKKELYLYDLRQQGQKKTELFNVMYAACYLQEELVSLEKLENSFQHLVVSNHHLFICDERYPKIPVMVWMHMLKDLPLYCSSTTYGNNGNSSSTVSILGTQGSPEIAAFFIDSPQSQIHPVSLEPPLFLSSAMDCIDSLKLHCLNIDESVTRRFSYPLTGVCALPHNQKTGFTVFHLTSLGDLFYQDFEKLVNCVEERTYRVDVGCALLPPERILSHLQYWIRNIDVSKAEEEFSDKVFTQINADLKRVLTLPEEISSNCAMCRSTDIHTEKDLVLSELCASCGLSSLESHELCKSFTNLSLQAGPLYDNSLCLDYDNNSLLEFHDTFSQKILKPWISSSTSNDAEDEVSVSQFSSDALINKSRSSIESIVNSTYEDGCSMYPMVTDTSFQINTQGSASINSLKYGEDYSEEFVPPSQEFRQLAGETVRSARQMENKNTSSLNDFDYRFH